LVREVAVVRLHRVVVHYLRPVQVLVAAPVRQVPVVQAGVVVLVQVPVRYQVVVVHLVQVVPQDLQVVVVVHHLYRRQVPRPLARVVL
jgi:hypothetical protein